MYKKFQVLLVPLFLLLPMLVSAEAVSSDSCYLKPTTLLQKGGKANDKKSVVTLQTILNKNGYLSEKPNGVFSIETQVAVQKLQKEKGLKVTGITGKYTVYELNKMGCDKAVAKRVVPSDEVIKDKKDSTSATATFQADALLALKKKIDYLNTTMLKLEEETLLVTKNAPSIVPEQEKTDLILKFQKTKDSLGVVNDDFRKFSEDSLLTAEEGITLKADLTKYLDLMKSSLLTYTKFSLKSEEDFKNGTNPVWLDAKSQEKLKKDTADKISLAFAQYGLSESDKLSVIQGSNEVFDSRNEVLKVILDTEKSGAFSDLDSRLLSVRLSSYQVKNYVFLEKVSSLASKYK